MSRRGEVEDDMRKSSSGGRATDGWTDIQWQGSESWFDGPQKWRPEAPATSGTFQICSMYVRSTSYLHTKVQFTGRRLLLVPSRAEPEPEPELHPPIQHRLSSTKRLNIRQPTLDRPISPPHPHTNLSAHHVRHARPPNDAYETHDACSPGKPSPPPALVCATHGAQTVLGSSRRVMTYASC